MRDERKFMKESILRQKLSINKNGVLNGLMSAIMWGIDTVLIGLVIMYISYFHINRAMLLAPFISAFLHDLCSTIWIAIYLIFKKKLSSIRVCLKSRSAKYVIIGGLLGGPIGMAGYLLAIKYLGASLTATISSIYPAVGAIISKVFLKEKMNKSGWLGLSISIIGIILIGYTKENLVQSKLGFIFIALCVISWGSEAVICSIGMKDEEISSDLALFLRQATSALVYGIIIIPIIKGIFLTISAISQPIIILIIFTAFFGSASYMCYYTAIHKLGPTRAMGINITYFIWAIIFDTIFMGKQLSLKIIVLGTIIMIGSYLIAKDS